MQQQPLFSVLIANYNNGKYLMEAIESVRMQTYTNWEIILVDDGSTDNSRTIYQELEQDPIIHIFYNEKNMGCGYTKRRCAELANGEICGFLDPDDTLTLEALSTMVESHITHPNHSLIYSQFYYSDCNLNILEISNHQQIISSDMSFLAMPFSGAISHFATFKIEHYNKTIGISISQHRAVDIDLYLILEEVGETLFIPKPLYYYRTNTGKNISLGENHYKATFWDIITRAKACERRDEDLEQLVYPMMEQVIEKSILFGMEATRNTKTYKLGNFLLKPLKLVQKMIKHEQ